MEPMNFKRIISRGYVLHVRSDSKLFKDERCFKFIDVESKHLWNYYISRLMEVEGYRFLSPYTSVDETNKHFEITYEINHLLLERLLDEIGAKLITTTKQYTQTLGGFRCRVAKMPIIRGILFDSMHHKMLYLVKNPNLFNEN